MIIPIIHAASDLGNLQGSIDRVKIGGMDGASARSSVTPTVSPTISPTVSPTVSPTARSVTAPSTVSPSTVFLSTAAPSPAAPSPAARTRTGVDAFWENLRAGLRSWNVDFAQVQIYQDALPIGPSLADPIEPRIVRELAAKGSVNHHLIEWLMERKATLFGTEDPGLLVKEYQLVKRFLDLRLDDHRASDQEEAVIAGQQSVILNQRDRFIANRIDTTLSRSQIGLIFLGMLHRLEDHLPSDIEVSYPFGQPSQPQRDSFSS